MMRKVILGLLMLCLLCCPASAFWEQDFELSENDLPVSDFTGVDLTANEHGYCLYTGNLPWGTTRILKIDMPWTGYLGYSVNPTSTNSWNCVKFYDVNNNLLWSSMDYFPNTGWQRIELLQSGAGISLYKNGVFAESKSYSNTVDVAYMTITMSPWNSMQGSCGYRIDDLTAKSSHAMIGMDDSALTTDAGQYYRVGAGCVGTGSYYQTKLYSPTHVNSYTLNFTNANLLTEQLIPANVLTSVGEYSLHLYRVNSQGSAVYLNMRSFEVTDPAATAEGTITLDKTDYIAGEEVKVWTHLNNYATGYKVRCEFPTTGSNFLKEYSVTGNPHLGSFTIPNHEAVIGSHTVYLLNPEGEVAASAEMNVYIPGLPDIALDKEKYDRSDLAYIFYKDAKEDSTLNVILRYGGTTAQTLSYDVSGTGTIKLNLSSYAAADSIFVSIKDSLGYTNDQDNAKIIVGNFVLSGRVYNAKTGSVIPGATVTVQGSAVNSDTNGNYNLTALAGFANYSVIADGYNSISGTVAVFDLNTIHNFYLSPVLTNAGTGVYGTVVSSKTDYPLAGASVEVTNTDNLKRYSTIVDSKGYYSISNDDLTGNISIRVNFDNYDSIVSTVTVTSGSMQNHNFRLNAVPGYVEIDPSEHTGGQDSSNPGETAEERAYREKYGEMGRHPFDFNGDGQVENSEYKYAFERFAVLIGILSFMGFLMLITRRR